jgi:hypothetical protein
MREQTMVTWTFRRQYLYGALKRFAAEIAVGNAPASPASPAPRSDTPADPARRLALLSLHHH